MDKQETFKQNDFECNNNIMTGNVTTDRSMVAMGECSKVSRTPKWGGTVAEW